MRIALDVCLVDIGYKASLSQRIILKRFSLKNLWGLVKTLNRDGKCLPYLITTDCLKSEICCSAIID